MENSITQEIKNRLNHVEKEHNVKILFAIESGSRAWGFESPNSDYDVRFVYVHQPEYYLTINDVAKREVIEYPIVDEIDINGWDLMKALDLYWKSNPAIVEWIRSPIVYSDNGKLISTLQNLLPTMYNCVKGIYHYKNMALNQYTKYLNKSQVKQKSYLYALRALLSVKWIEEQKCPAPIEFSELLKSIELAPELTNCINQLVQIKKASGETQATGKIKLLDNFILSEIGRLAAVQPNQKIESRNLDNLNKLFRSYIYKH